MNEYEYLNTQQIVNNSRYPFTIGQMRHYLMHRHRNGLQHAIRKIGKCIYFRKDLFDLWIESKAEKKRS
jgi:hypothetical protein